MRLLSSLLLAFACATGCGGQAKEAAPAKSEPMPATAAPASATTPPAPEPSCEEAAQHVIQLMLDSEELKKATPEQREAAAKMGEGLKVEIVKECQEKSWSVATRQCVLDGKAMEELEHCDQKKQTP